MAYTVKYQDGSHSGYAYEPDELHLELTSVFQFSTEIMPNGQTQYRKITINNGKPEMTLAVISEID